MSGTSYVNQGMRDQRYASYDANPIATSLLISSRRRSNDQNESGHAGVAGGVGSVIFGVSFRSLLVGGVVGETVLAPLSVKR